MTFTSQEIREVYKSEVIGKRAGNGGMIPLSMCDKKDAVFSKIKPLGHGFMLRDVVKLHKKSKTSVVAK